MRLATLLPILGSAGLHALVLLAVSSASGAEPAWDERQAARFVGDTFEVEALLEAPELAPSAPQKSVPAAEPPAHEPEAPARPEPPLAPAVAAPEASAVSDAHTAPEALAAAQAPPAPEARPVPVAPPLPVTQPAPVTPVPAPSLPRPDRTGEGAPDSGEAAPRTPLEASTPSAGAAPAFGERTLPAGTSSLAKGFTRAAPRAAYRDPVWHRLGLGSAGRAVFSIEVDAQGKVVGKASVADEPQAAPHLKGVIERTVLMLKSGTFALTPAGITAGVQKFELSAQIRQATGLDDGLAEPHDLLQIGRLVEPTRVTPGKANFTYNSGRQVELTIRMLAD